MVDPSYVHNLQFRCVHCERKQFVKVHECMNIKIGTLIESYAGGGGWGKCKFCGKSGLRAVTEVRPEKKGPVGWRNIPKK